MGEWEVQGHPHREFEGSLGYLRPDLKMQNKQKQINVCYEWGRKKTKQVRAQGTRSVLSQGTGPCGDRSVGDTCLLR